MIKCLCVAFLIILGIAQSQADIGEPLNPKNDGLETYLHVCQNGDSLLVETNAKNNVDLKVFTCTGRLLIHSDISEAQKAFAISNTDDRLYFMAKAHDGNIVADWVAVKTFDTLPLACD